MAALRNLGILVIVLVAARPGWAQTYTLTETVQPDDCFHIRLAMQLTGEWHVQRDDSAVPIRITAAANHEFPERVLIVGPKGWPVKTARHYETAEAVITAGRGEPSKRTLRPECRLIVAQMHKDTCLNYCPACSLTREELETLEHLDTLHVTGLLPNKEVKIQESWKVPDAVAQALCSFDGLIQHDLACKLEAVQGDEARIAVSGSASGITLGAMAKLTISATCGYNLKSRRVTALEWKQKDVREQGPASPAAAIEAAWTMNRTYLEAEPPKLSNVALIKGKVELGSEPPPEDQLQLCHSDPKGRFLLTYERDWQLASQTEEHLIMRLMERGDWVAQATITPWTRYEPGKHMSAENFKEAIADMPGWDADEIRDDGELQQDEGRWVYRVSALGEMDGLKVLQNFYLIAGPDGNQVVVSVTLREAQAQKLGTRDLKLVDGVALPVKAK
jgi:hypothetical protein